MKTVDIRNDSMPSSMTADEFIDWANSAVDEIKALKKGTEYSKIRVQFRSTHEPYEDFLGDPELTIVGDRALNETELLEEQKHNKIQRLANKLGVSYYEASTITDLQARGKIPEIPE